MPDTLYEEARRCPTCKQPGKDVGSKPAPENMGRIHFYECQNDRCEDVNERWLVQELPDGTIPTPDLNKRGKNYPTLTPGQLSAGMMQLEDLLQRDLREQREL
jgi:hypothetical protein